MPLVTELLRVSDRGNWEVFEKAVVKKYLLTYGILALFCVYNLRRVGTHVLVRCRVEIGFTVCEICKYICFIKNVLKGLSCFSFVSRAQYFVTQYLEERWDRHVGQKTLSFPSFWIESLHLHCKGGEDEETERKEWTAWCG